MKTLVTLVFSLILHLSLFSNNSFDYDRDEVQRKIHHLTTVENVYKSNALYSFDDILLLSGLEDSKVEMYTINNLQRSDNGSIALGIIIGAGGCLVLYLGCLLIGYSQFFFL